jgi:NAD(P)H-flavin reductase/nitrite reductase/ring-hydroxylating ferredoxin subunit
MKLTGNMSIVDNIEDDKYYLIESPKYLWNKTILRLVNWSEFNLCFRHRLIRIPDIYNIVINILFRIEDEDIENTIENLSKNYNKNNEKIQVKIEDNAYEISKYCPHQGENLTEAWIYKDDKTSDNIIVCPRHCWKFNLDKDGKCLNSDITLECHKLKDIEDIDNIGCSKKNNIELIKLISKKQITFTENPVFNFKFENKHEKDNLNHIYLKQNNIIRPYTIIKDNDEYINLYIKLYRYGEMSNILKSIKENDTMECFFKKELFNTEPILQNNILLIVGGTGITPIYNILAQLKQYQNIDKFKCKVTILWGNKSKDDIFLTDQINQINLNNFTINYFTNKRINKDAILEEINKFENPENVYSVICGPPNMENYISKTLDELKINHKIL